MGKKLRSSVERRDFLKISAVGAVAAAVGMSGCSNPASAEDAAASANWDEEYDFIVAGSGTAVMGAIAATAAQAKVLVVEKASAIGGTTRLSGGIWWEPDNPVMKEAGFSDVSTQEVLAYLEACDAYGGTTRDKISDYLENASTVFKWMIDDIGVGTWTYWLPDYYNLPGASPTGRGVGVLDRQGEYAMASIFFDEYIEPTLEERGVTVMTGAAVTGLLTDSEGAVVGIEVDGGKKRIKAEKGVLLGTGGFDHNTEMRKAFLRGPLLGSVAVPTNTGDGQLMGMRVGAKLGNMGSHYPLAHYITDESLLASGQLENTNDWNAYAGCSHCITVNLRGRRIGNEGTAYGSSSQAFHAYDSRFYALSACPGFMIFDSSAVEKNGWPPYASGVEEKPEWVSEYASLEELAADNGIDPAGLIDEVTRFNTFCDEGKDAEWHRGEWAGELLAGDSPGNKVDEDLANPCLGPIRSAPFYVAKTGPGACSTSGGLEVNFDSQVLSLDGEVIPGLYASGATTASIFGSAYPGPGVTLGDGYYKAIRAANHALDLSIL